MKFLPYLLLFVSAVVCGCSRNSDQEIYYDGDFLELAERRVGPFVAVTNRPIAEMSEDDVVVAVNGYPLTKRMFGELMMLKARELMSREGMDSGTASAKLAEFQKQYIPIFVSQRLIIDEAKRLNVISSNELVRVVNNAMKNGAKQCKKSLREYEKSFPGDIKYLFYEIATKATITALVEKCIPPLVETDNAFVSNVQAQVAIENEQASATNALLRVKMAEWKREIEQGKITFEEVAEKFSNDEPHESEKPGTWGEYERGSMDDKKLQAAAFSLKMGEISDPVEDDDGFHLIKVTKITPPRRNEEGKVILDEVRQLSHIYCEKTPLLIVQSDDELFKDLKHQMQVRAVDNYVENLRTNGVNRIEYPNGKKLF